MNKLLLLLVLFGSCYSSKVALHEVNKAQSIFPAIVRNACISYYPTKDSVSEKITYLQGATDTFTKFIEVDCSETIFFDTIINNVEVIKEKIVPKIVKVPCPTATKRVDTFYKDKIISYENTALIDAKDAVIDSLTIESIEAAKDAKDWRSKAIKLSILSLFCYLLICIFVYLKIKK